MLKKFAPRSGSSVSTAATSNSALPSFTLLPTSAASAEVSRSSSQTVPGLGPPAAIASGALSRGAMRNRPRSGYDSVTPLAPVSRLLEAWPAGASLPTDCAMLMKFVLSATARPRRRISARTSDFQGWSPAMSRSPPSSW